MVLTEQVKCDKILRGTVQERLALFRKYLASDKFNSDTSIQVWEINRFTIMLRNVIEARDDARNPEDFTQLLESIT